MFIKLTQATLQYGELVASPCWVSTDMICTMDPQTLNGTPVTWLNMGHHLREGVLVMETPEEIVSKCSA